MSKEWQTLILETPNAVFVKRKLGTDQIRRNIIALTVLFTTGLRILATITPLMIRDIPQETNWLVTLLKSNGATPVFTRAGEDPDEVALKLAERYRAPILTNDKFRQSQYQKYGSRSRVIRFTIRGYKLKIRNTYWRQQIFGRT